MWPQYTILALSVIGVIAAGTQGGKDFVTHIIGVVIGQGLLIAGGFYNGLLH